MSTGLDGRGSRKEVWVGLFVILGVLATLGTLFALTDPALFRGRYVVATIVTDAAGVRRGDPVQLRGVNIGRVQRFKITGDTVKISLEIEGEYKFPADSTVVLGNNSLLGGTVMDIQAGQSTQMAVTGAELPGRTEPGIMAAAFDVAKRAQATLERAQRMLSDETIGHVNASAADLSATLKRASAMVEEQRHSLATLEASLQKSAEQLHTAVAKPEFQGLPEQMAATMTRLQNVADTLDRSTKALEGVTARVDRGEGTLGALSKDPKLYDSMSAAAAQLNKATTELTTLITDIKKQPKRYFKFSVF
jgi:phospholipid/cholesterol/gamma-HCH transport system substrate-binding protein